ncbi:glycerophosphodiester phosphodiesterase [Pelobium manganitolerans]|uniref:glycerophosphodiester phosphodiesterase n=1 Tax=Pelobium manganitolerans TaxID=1842495 RepID=UPI001FEC3623|nr:glycerophosphodiester phosphodiesterase family protein [Pelobium manganitolerans]
MSSKNMQATNPVIAHRGAWKGKALPQNSIASLQEAIRLNCAGSEFDIHLTADDVLVVNHDDKFYGMEIEKSSYAQLLTKKHNNGESIPTVEEYFKAGLNQKQTKLICEIKPSVISKERTLRATRMVVDLAKKMGGPDRIEFISFDYDALKYIQKVAPKFKTAYLNGNTMPQQIKSDGLTGLDFHMSFYKKFTTWIADAHKMGLTVNVWTVNKEEDMSFFLNRGADYITTDYPELLLKVWSRHARVQRPH